MPDSSKILLVDDDPGIRASLKFSLELEGFTVELFESGESLASLPDFPDASCLVLDYRLPGMDGLALLASLRRRGVTQPAVLITGLDSKAIRGRAAEAGVMIIEKPLLCDALSAAIIMLAGMPAGPASKAGQQTFKIAEDSGVAAAEATGKVGTDAPYEREQESPCGG